MTCQAGSPGLGLLAIRRLLTVERQPLATPRPVLFVRVQLQGLLFPFHRRVEVARLGIGRGERVEPIGGFPAVSSQARVADSTACLPSRYFGSGQVAQIQARSL